MSHAKRDRAFKKLRKYLGMCPEGPFLDMCWALDMLLSGEGENAARYLKYPEEAANAGYGSKYAVYPWEIETLVSERLLAPKFVPAHEGLQKILNCQVYDAAANLVNELRDLENADAGIYLKRFGILYEMHRIAQRQFPVQAGFFNKAQYYRFGFIYGGPECTKYFEGTHGVSINDFAFAAFAFISNFLNKPRFRGKPDMAFLGIDQGAVKSAVRLLCAPLDRAREEHKQDIARVTANWGISPPVAYRPSYLRKRPIIELDDGVMYCPLPELVALRTTAGLYYDLVGGPPLLRNEASKRFEMYSAEFVRRSTRFQVSDEIEYRVGQRNWRTPDVLCERNGAVFVAIECKASKLTYDAQFAEAPAAFAKRGYEELAKGVVQLWRFVAHSRLGLAPKRADASIRCLLLTLDTWLAMSGDLKREVIAAAKELAKGETDIREEDQRPIVFASIFDFERTLMDGSEETFLDAMDHAATESFTGWMLADVQRDRGNEKRTDREYPFEVADVFPFFAAIDQLKEERVAKSAG